MMRRYKLEIRGKEYVIDVQELAADSFEVFVGNEAYAVTLTSDEDIAEGAITPDLKPAASAGGLAADAAASAAAGGAVASASSPAVGVRSVRKAATATASAAPRKPAGGGTSSLNAPMPGVIVEIDVKAGDTVTRGQLIAILDAMKMHNHIKSPRAGTIREVCVDAGQAVGHGDPLVRFEEG
jgi:biotin carboxyl carrier protein